MFPLAFFPPICTSNIKSQQAGPAAFSPWLPAFLQLASKGSRGARVVVWWPRHVRSAGSCWLLWGQAAFLSPLGTLSINPSLSHQCRPLAFSFQSNFHILHPPTPHSTDTLIMPSPTVLIEAHRHFVATSLQSGVAISRAERGRGGKRDKNFVLPSASFQ